MTYARSRLWLGVTSVGSIVTLCTLALLGRIPERLLPVETLSAGEELFALFATFLFFVAISAPFDLWGGFVLPRRFGRPTPRVFSAFSLWLVGALTQAFVFIGVAFAVLRTAQVWGDAAGVAVIAMTSILLLVFQNRLAVVVGRLSLSPVADDPELAELVGSAGLEVARVDVADNRDQGFTGGWTGWPGFERLIVPRRWVESLSKEELRGVLTRRRGVLASGARARGVWLGYSWNLAGLALAVVLPGFTLSTVAGLVGIALLVTIWSFLGALVLPSLSRPAVFAADRFALAHGVTESTLVRTMGRLDQWQDDEPTRPVGVETVFHPIPALERREARLTSGLPVSAGAWHTARMALFLSWACFGLLGRAVHCNCGRPELWVLLPAD